MQLYAAIDLHSNNSFLVVLDEEDRTVFSKAVAQRTQGHCGWLAELSGTDRSSRRGVHLLCWRWFYAWTANDQTELFCFLAARGSPGTRIITTYPGIRGQDLSVGNGAV
jgi:hypothetical protein